MMADNIGYEFQQGTDELVLQYDVSDAVRTMWKNSEIPVQLNLNQSYHNPKYVHSKLIF